MAISTYQAYLMHSTDGTTYTKLVDIKDFPDLGGAPEQLETTTTSDAMQTFILGIQQLDSLQFTANYTKTDFQTIKALEGASGYYALYFGADSGGSPDGHNGKFSWQGEVSVFVAGGGVNEVVDMTITIAPSTVITFA